MAAAPEFDGGNSGHEVIALLTSCSPASDDNGSDDHGSASTKAVQTTTMVTTLTSSTAANAPEVPKMIQEEQVVASKNQKLTAAAPTTGVVSSSTTATTTIPIAKSVGSTPGTSTTCPLPQSSTTRNNNNKNNNSMEVCTPTNTLSNNNAADFERIIRRPHLFQQSKIKPSPTFSFGGILVKDYVYSLDEDVAQIDHLLKQVSKFALLTWISLIGISYWAAPPGSIQRYTGAERNALLVELSILTTAVLVKHIPLVWEMNVMEMSTPSTSASSSEVGKSRRIKSRNILGKKKFSGVLTGGMTAQLIAISSVAIMVLFPVPVMIDPILGCRVHLIRWCEWTPCAGFLTLMMDCIDAPQYDGTKFTHPWKTIFVTAAMESLSTFCGLIFPFCTNWYVWMGWMIFSCVTFLSVPIRYFEKRRLFQTIRWRGGRRVDEIELYERTRTSLALNFVCSGVWSTMVIAYFVTSCGHLVVSESWTIMHNPAITMFGNCTLDLLSKCLYMALILDAHQAIFDESKRANRRLAELRNMMGVVWENSSDTIAISVRKISGNVTSMVSPSFFRSALTAAERERIQDISAVVLEHSHTLMNSKQSSATKNLPTKVNHTSGVGIEIIRKVDFDSVDFQFYGDNVAHAYTEYETEDMTTLVNAFTDMLLRAWRDDSEEHLFEYDTSFDDGKKRTKFEVMLTRLDANAKVLVVRNVSERYQRFEAEKRFIFETTARQRDAEANRFTRHEVKNGILAAIEICGNIHDHISSGIDWMRDRQIVSEPSLTFGIENVDELDQTLHEVLDIILAGTVSVL